MEDNIKQKDSLRANGAYTMPTFKISENTWDAAAYHKLMVIQTIANVLRSGCYDEQTFNGLETNLTLLGK